MTATAEIPSLAAWPWSGGSELAGPGYPYHQIGHTIKIRYSMTSMAKKAISVTIDTNNLTWLKGRAAATRLRSISELIDRLIHEARSSGSGGAIRSVVGTIDIDAADALLDRADEAIRTQFARSLRRPIAVEKNKRSKPRRSVRKRG